MTSDLKIDYDTIFKCMVQASFDKIIFTSDINKDKGIKVVCNAVFYREGKKVGSRELTEDIVEGLVDD